jgi:hypothetical protein
MKLIILSVLTLAVSVFTTPVITEVKPRQLESQSTVLQTLFSQVVAHTSAISKPLTYLSQEG